ncbi:NADP-dependent oxidoreductase [Pseudorhodoferax sp.]|uniref:NADP-dependent oxidoreductase n=1 Tax=Pseudorhodoferax sp. TaxID=1993553 RepID=UPI0039E6AA0E
MQAVAFHAFGGPEVLHIVQRPMPVPTADQVVVRVVAAAVNPTDLLMRAGLQAASMHGLAPPFVPGMEFAGHVHTTCAGAPHLHPGQPVMGIVHPRQPQGGCHAEYVAVPAASLVPVPPGIALDAAATVPMNGLTARIALELLALPPGASLLVTGGTGAVGSCLIPLARRAGLRVVADAHPADRALLAQLGAQDIVARGPSMTAAVRALYPQGVDALVDGALLGEAAAACVRDGGGAALLRSQPPPPDALRDRLHLHPVQVLSRIMSTAELAELAERLQDGTLRPRIAARLPFTQAAEAHRMLERGGLRGRVVLLFSDAVAAKAPRQPAPP